jgi:hypothetical protein
MLPAAAQYANVLTLIAVCLRDRLETLFLPRCWHGPVPECLVGGLGRGSNASLDSLSSPSEPRAVGL